MVKIAEKEKKRGVMTPIFGLLLAGGLFAISYLLTTEVIIKTIPQVNAAVRGMPNPITARIMIAVGVWVFLLAISFGLVAILAGKDPERIEMPLPPKASELKAMKKKNRR